MEFADHNLYRVTSFVAASTHSRSQVLVRAQPRQNYGKGVSYSRRGEGVEAEASCRMMRGVVEGRLRFASECRIVLCSDRHLLPRIYLLG